MKRKCQAHWLRFDFLDGKSEVAGWFTEPLPSHLYLNVTQKPLAWACARGRFKWRTEGEASSPSLMDPSTPVIRC
ncbi:hypothetical protein NQZ68_007627 [Dissostichus eleginoides]|nr:hypothetical protein NQZ68_007627 [Dissostichus eleginoides]